MFTSTQIKQGTRAYLLVTAADIDLTIADFITIQGNVSFGSAITVAGQSAKPFAGKNLDIFIGQGPYKNADGTINPNAIGVLLTNGTIGMLDFGNGRFGLFATGNVAFVGLPGLNITGTVTVRINTTGLAFTQNLTIANPNGTPQNVSVSFANANAVTEFIASNVNISIGGVLKITAGTVAFSKRPNGVVLVTIDQGNVSITVDGQEAFKIARAVRFTMGGTDGFRLQDIASTASRSSASARRSRTLPRCRFHRRRTCRTRLKVRCSIASSSTTSATSKSSSTIRTSRA